jgi:hypothetical protein
MALACSNMRMMWLRELSRTQSLLGEKIVLVSWMGWARRILNSGEAWYSPNPLYACPSILCLLKSALETLAFVRTFRIGRSAANSAARLERWYDVVHGRSLKTVQVTQFVRIYSRKVSSIIFLPSGHRSPEMIHSARRHCLKPQSQKHHQRGAGTMNREMRMMDCFREERRRAVNDQRKQEVHLPTHAADVHPPPKTWHSC